LWSRFDQTFGRILGLKHSGAEIYFSKFWYSHHAFMHSLAAALLLTLFMGFVLFLCKDRKKNAFWASLFAGYTKNIGLFLGFVLGYSIHLVQDMPTPASTWGGVNLLWPSKSYIGGTGDIWWWNNYDLFLIVWIVILSNLILLVLSRWTKLNAAKGTCIVFLLGAALIVFQIKTRNFDFNYTGHSLKYTYYEIKSKEIQKRILGRKLYRIMERFDRMVKVNF
ncbi:MAG TPA: metal-dependent hydrolase, partial [Cytophagales bacterium]|nr:metal-dependent hydrolase [Cytophagales bacterium]